MHQRGGQRPGERDEEEGEDGGRQGRRRVGGGAAHHVVGVREQEEGQGPLGAEGQEDEEGGEGA